MKTKLVVLIFITLFNYSIQSIANDGFYQGSGNTLIPIQNKKMTVLSEKLIITPLAAPKCYDFFIPHTSKDSKGDPIDGAWVQIGKHINCKNHHFSEVLVTKWYAKAVYKVQSSEDQKEVQMGFPVPDWTYSTGGSDGRVDLLAPAVTNFKTSIDGKPITFSSVQSIPLENSSKSSGPGFIWKLDFKKGSEYELISEYDFGVSYSNGFYKGFYPDGEILWFDKRSQAELKHTSWDFEFNESVNYFLSPIKLWGGEKPKSISIQIKSPKNIPVYYLVPATNGIDCVDKDSLFYKWENAFPDEEFAVRYPIFKSNRYPPITQPFEYDAWMSLLEKQSRMKDSKIPGSRLKMTCSLLSELKKNLPKDADLNSIDKDKFKYRNHEQGSCVKSCDL